ncbi:MAG: substrate-binding domain-containing protein [Synergistaceae bacterium]|nr:substrate-binding domain-containing protein [Synergistaceae bacterium]
MKKVLALVLVVCVVLCGASAAMAAKYAVILKTTNSDFWRAMYDGTANYAKEAGLDVDMFAAQSDIDYEGQLAILENCINSGAYQGIAIAPCNGVNLIAGVKNANQAGITIWNIDERFDAEEMKRQEAVCVGFDSSDNVQIGHMGGEYLASLLAKGAHVAVIEGLAGNQSSEDRANGAKSAFREAEMNIVASKSCDWDRQMAMDTAMTWIQQFPDLKAIYCCNDGMAMGAIQAVIVSGKLGEIYVCGTDGDSDAIQSVKDGNLTATVAQDSANIGITALKGLVAAVENPAAYPASSQPEKTPVSAVLVSGK